ncbi:MAG TPA: PilW family protein [Woeseiaceae bacterium]|jgi:type IV pilus assembly protein PilW|nr:PilW family protein [Woeseiaceae bacterium]
MRNSTRTQQAGFSLVELMVAMLLSITLAIGVVSVFVNNSHSFNQDENVSRMQDDARHALREIAFEISMAGNYAELHLPDNVTPDALLAIGADCGPAGELNWMYRTVEAGTGNTLSIAAIDNATDADAKAAHSCFIAGEVQDGTDIVVIRRVAGAREALPRPGSIYLRTNGTVGLLYRAPFPVAPSIPVALPFADYEYRPSIFYVRNFANTAGDGIPTLCRKVLRGGNPDMQTECLATGIEDLQLEYGIDTTEDGQPNVFTPSPTLAEIQNAVSARIFILARTTEIDTRYTNDKVYSISNAPDYTPGDSFHRRVFSTNVTIQNIRSLSMMSF